MKYTILALVLLSSCGKGLVGSAGNPAPLPTPPGPILVQLNAQQTYTMGTEAVQLSDARQFTVPSAIQVVNGVFNCGSPGCNNSVIRAEIHVNSVVCRYESYNIAASFMGLLDCNGAPTQHALASGDTITLVPSYAPGLLLEVQFFLTK